MFEAITVATLLVPESNRLTLSIEPLATDVVTCKPSTESSSRTTLLCFSFD